jgi:hypothetical protein
MQMAHLKVHQKAIHSERLWVLQTAMKKAHWRGDRRVFWMDYMLVKKKENQKVHYLEMKSECQMGLSWENWKDTLRESQ